MKRPALALLALLLGGCGTVGGGGQVDDDVTLLLGAKPSAVHAGIFLATERGFDEAESIDLTVRRRGDALKLLRRRRVQAAILPRPLRGTVCVMAITQQPRPGHFVCVLRSTLEDARPTVKALVATLQRGYTEANADPESAVQAMLSAVGGLDRTTLSARLDRLSPSFAAGVPAIGYLRRGTLPPGAFDRTVVGPVSRD